MDGLNLFQNNYQQLLALLMIVEQFCDDIRTQFDLDKGANPTFIKGKMTSIPNATNNQKTTKKDIGKRVSTNF